MDCGDHYSVFKMYGLMYYKSLMLCHVMKDGYNVKRSFLECDSIKPSSYCNKNKQQTHFINAPLIRSGFSKNQRNFLIIQNIAKAKQQEDFEKKEPEGLSFNQLKKEKVYCLLDCRVA